MLLCAGIIPPFLVVFVPFNLSHTKVSYNRTKQHFTFCLIIPLFCLCHFTGKPFDTASPVNYATSNIISAIVYGSRFEYNNPQFMSMVERSNESISVVGSAQIQVNFILALEMAAVLRAHYGSGSRQRLC